MSIYDLLFLSARYGPVSFSLDEPCLCCWMNVERRRSGKAQGRYDI